MSAIAEEKAKRPQVCLLGATLGTSNMGVNALTVGAVQCVLHRWRDAEIFLLDYDKAPREYEVEIGSSRVTVPLISMRFSKKPWTPNHIAALIVLTLLSRLMPGERARAWFTRKNACLNALSGADLAASIAGGDSFSDIYGIRRFLYVVLPQMLCLLAGKRLLLMPQTIGPFHNWFVRRVAAYILRHAELVYARDYRGVAYARELIRSGAAGRRAQFCHDMGFLLEPAREGDPQIEGLGPDAAVRRIVGLNVSGLLSKAGGKFETRAGFTANYDLLISNLIEVLIRSRQVTVLLLPHVFGEGGESDSSACARIYEALRGRYAGYLGVVTGRYDQHQIKRVIGSCDVFIGSRMHACIAAASQGVPAVSLAYSDKFIGVMETIGLSGLVADLRTATEQEVLAVVDAALRQCGEYRDRLRREMPAVCQSVLNLFSGIEVAGTR